MKRITPKQALVISISALVAGLFLYAVAQISNNTLISVLALIALFISLLARFGFYRCPECGRYLGRGFARYCHNCGEPIDY